jgi:hypothetical protein
MPTPPADEFAERAQVVLMTADVFGEMTADLLADQFREVASAARSAALEEAAKFLDDNGLPNSALDIRALGKAAKR